MLETLDSLVLAPYTASKYVKIESTVAIFYDAKLVSLKVMLATTSNIH